MQLSQRSLKLLCFEVGPSHWAIGLAPRHETLSTLSLEEHWITLCAHTAELLGTCTRILKARPVIRAVKVYVDVAASEACYIGAKTSLDCILWPFDKSCKHMD